jgi:Ubiquitin family
VTPAVNPPPYSGPMIVNNVMFRDLDGKTLTLHAISISWKVKQLRKKLGDEKALEVEFYRFIWGGKQLDDGRYL